MINSLKLTLIAGSLVVSLGSSYSLMAQTDTIYKYSYLTGGNNGTYDYTNGFTISPGVNAPTEMNGANWATLINSGRVWGTGHSTTVRAFDWAEDNQVNYLTTGATDGAATW